MGAIVDGVIFGLTLSIMIGPVFFMLIQASLENGFRHGVFIAIGISLSDVIYILLFHWGASNIFLDGTSKNYMATVGGVVLILFGLASLLKKKGANVASSSRHRERGGSLIRHFFKGFFVNSLSPFVPLFWLGAVAMASGKYGFATSGNILFFVSVQLVVLIVDMSKAYLAGRLRKLITEKLLRRMNIAVGVLLIIFGIQLFFYEF